MQRIWPQWVGGSGAVGLLLVRLVMGLGLLLHGWPKIQKPFSWMGPDMPGILQALAALAEFGGGLALIVGLLVPLASLGIFFTMLTAIVTVHLKSGNPFVGKDSYELPAIYLVLSLLFLLVGPGKISLDALLFDKTRKR